MGPRLHPDRIVQAGGARVIAALATPVGDPEALIDAREGEEVQHEDLQAKEDDVEGHLAVPPGRVGSQLRRRPDRPHPEPGDDEGGEAGEADDVELRPHAAVLAEVLAFLGGGQHDGEEEEDEVGDVEEEQVKDGDSLDPEGGGLLRLVEGVEGQDGEGDDEDEGDGDTDVGGLDGLAKGWIPAQVRVGGAEDTQGEEEKDDVEDQDADVDEDAGGDGEAHVGRSGCQRESEDEGGDAGHAETEKSPGDEESVASSSVAYEKGHIRDGADEEDGDEDGANRDILVDIGMSASRCGFGIDIWWLLVNISKSISIDGFLSMRFTVRVPQLDTYARNLWWCLVHSLCLVHNEAV